MPTHTLAVHHAALREIGHRVTCVDPAYGELARADEAAEQPQLGSFEHAVGVQPAPGRFAICEPESQAHRARHEDAVPAET